ncbi:MAG TPA: DNA translocase FtsK [Gemmatimonadales bacterium]|nr:DNA translocase FtsK [Gemmatimonadales bacterium]
MTPDARRRIGAVAALVLGLSLGLALLPIHDPATVPAVVGRWLWRYFGLGAVGFPLLGVGVALAGFGWVERLDMRRTALLVTGLAVLLPFFVGAIARLPGTAFDPELGEWSVWARLVGIVPGFFADALTGVLGRPITVLAGFLLLTVLTVLTVGWHPLARFERRGAEAQGRGGAEAQGRRGAGTRGRRGAEAQGEGAEPRFEPAVQTSVVEVEELDAEAPASRPRKPAKPRKPARTKPAPAVAEGEPLDPGDRWEVDLLTPHQPAVDPAQLREELKQLQVRLQETLATFGVQARVEDFTSGPVVTQFYVRLEAGVKMNRLVALADDLALAMKARSIRVARVPGSDVVGIEVPNPRSEFVRLREILESEAWEGEERVLPIALGKDVEGRAIVADLAKMPHLLVAGATGTGKSVGINTILTSLIYRYQRKEELRLLLVDPKMVELSMYNVLPHLRHAVVTDTKDAATALNWAVREMERRYQLLQVNGARNLADFNRKVEDGKPLKPIPKPKQTLATISAQEETTPAEPPEPEVYDEGKLPLVVIVVDELADLMMTVRAEVETPLARLAQKARAIGIHLLLATQRPSVDVLTGLIKANFPSRIAFRVASKTDSRTILDGNGAEALLGNGDMLFLQPGRNEPMRIQGAYVSTDETEAVMGWYEARRAALQGATEPDIIAEQRAFEVAEAGGGPAGEGAQGDRDPLFRQAAEVCLQQGSGSTSLLQRRLGIGYGRAARIIDQLEQGGILGPGSGSKPREVLIGFDQVEEYTS